MYYNQYQISTIHDGSISGMLHNNIIQRDYYCIKKSKNVSLKCMNSLNFLSS